MIRFEEVKRTDPRLTQLMKIHYSQPGGFVGRNICAVVFYGDIPYGCIVGGSATRFLPGRNSVLGCSLGSIINNLFYHIEPNSDGKYPIRNFSSAVVVAWMQWISVRWYSKYGEQVLGFETLVELPRTGELYRRAGWIEVGITKGYTCKRTGGKGTDSWSGKRVWDTQNLRPKRVFIYKLEDNPEEED